MSYEKLNLANGTRLTAEHLAHMETGIAGAAPAVESDEYPGCYYRMVNGVQEWLNPPMVAGVEYCTTERSGDLPVYAKRVSCAFSETLGSSSGISTLTVPHGVTGITTLVACVGRLGGGRMYPLPYLSTTGGFTCACGLDGTNSSIVIRVKDMTWSANAFEVDIYYTK